jgi:hypothetical protein
LVLVKEIGAVFSESDKNEVVAWEALKYVVISVVFLMVISQYMNNDLSSLLGSLVWINIYLHTLLANYAHASPANIFV